MLRSFNFDVEQGIYEDLVLIEELIYFLHKDYKNKSYLLK